MVGAFGSCRGPNFFARRVSYDLVYPIDGQEVLPIHPERSAKFLDTSRQVAHAQNRINQPLVRKAYGFPTASQNRLLCGVLHPCRVKTRVTQKPALLCVRKLEAVPVLALQNPIACIRFCMTETGALHPFVAAEAIRQVMVAEQEDRIRILHLAAQPVRGAGRILNRVLVVVEEVAEENDSVVLNGTEPVVGVCRVMVQVGG